MKFLILEVDKFLVLQTLLIVAMAWTWLTEGEPWFGLENLPNEYLYLLFSLLFILWEHNSENHPACFALCIEYRKPDNHHLFFPQFTYLFIIPA
jgi:hypothetical protein